MTTRTTRRPIPCFRLATQLNIREGTYGPAHDPYSYTERTCVLSDGTALIYHTGFSDRISLIPVESGTSRKFVGKPGELYTDTHVVRYNNYGTACEMFRKLTGMTVDQFDSYVYRARSQREEDPFGPASRYV